MRVQLKRPRHTQPHDRLHRIRCLLRRSRPRTLRSDGSCLPLAVTAPVAAVHRSNSEWQHAASQAVQKKPYLGLRSYSRRLPELATCLFGGGVQRQKVERECQWCPWTTYVMSKNKRRALVLQATQTRMDDRALGAFLRNARLSEWVLHTPSLRLSAWLLAPAASD